MLLAINVARDRPFYRSWWTWFYNWSHYSGIFFNQRITIKNLQKGEDMRINFILFKVYIEKYSKWSNVKLSADNYEKIVDFGYWRFYFS